MNPMEPTGRFLGDSLVGTTVVELVSHGEPATKARARVVNGHAYTPAKTKAAEAHIRGLLYASGVQPDADHDLCVDLHFRCGTRQRKDIDNLVKLVLDACNKVVWHDDFQVEELRAKVERGSGSPGFTMKVTRIARHTLDCLGCGMPLARGGSRARAKYCSADCKSDVERTGSQVPCLKCGVPVYQQPSQVGRRAFCSIECSGAPQGMRRTHCKRGHEMTDDNVLERKTGGRICKRCNCLRAAAHRQGVPVDAYEDAA